MLIAVSSQENNLFYSNDPEIDQLTGCIGHLRGDFGRDGNEFWTTWWDHQEELKTQDFKNDLDSVVNTMKQDGLLSNLKAMRKICYSMPDAILPSSGGNSYGFRHDSDQHSFYLRASTQQGDYNFYCYCYQKDTLEQYLASLQPEQTGPTMDQSM